MNAKRSTTNSSRRKSESNPPVASKHTRMVQDYLKAIYSTTEWDQDSFSVSSLAEYMGVAVSTASENIGRLSDNGLVKHEPYRGITLTEEGERLALEMVRKHRLIETYLCEKLNYDWDEVHDEAEILEHAASDRLIDHIDAVLGYPSYDPHGDPIPPKDGVFKPRKLQLIDKVPLGSEVKIERINDDSPQLLRFLDNAQIRPGVMIKPISYTQHVGIMNVEVGGKAIALGQPAVEAIWVRR